MSWEQTVPAKREDGESNYEVPPDGAQLSVLVGLIDLGSHERVYQGVSDGYYRQCALIWELLNEKQTDGRPFYVIRQFTNSYHEKAALRQWLEKWRGKKYGEGDKIKLTDCLGRACLLTIIHGESKSGNKYAKVEGIGGVPKGMTAGKPVATPVAWAIGDKKADGTPQPPPDPDWLPWLIGKPIIEVIQSSPEWNGRPVPKRVPKAKAGNGAPSQADEEQRQEPDGADIPF
jgi:hypothetical protein